MATPSNHTSVLHPFSLFSFSLLFYVNLTELCGILNGFKVEFLQALVVLVLMASFHWSALDTEKERWCMLSLLPPNADPPVCRDVLLLE